MSKLPEHLAQNPTAFLASLGIDLKANVAKVVTGCLGAGPTRLGVTWAGRDLVGGLLIWRLLSENPTPLLLWGGRRSVREEWMRALIVQMLRSPYVISSGMTVSRGLDRIYDKHTGAVYVDSREEFAFDPDPAGRFDVMLPDDDWHDGETQLQAVNYAQKQNTILLVSQWLGSKTG